jgi:hypothetical protein
MAVQILLREKHDPTRFNLCRSPLARHYGNDGIFWTTPLFEAIAYSDFDTVRRIVELHGACILEEEVLFSSLIRTGWDALEHFLNEASDWQEHRNYMVMYETILELDEGARPGDHVFIVRVWRESLENKRRSIAAVLWCFQQLFKDMGECVGKRMQAASVWDYEPKIKRGRF